MFEEICQLCGMVKGDCECSKNADKNKDSDNSDGLTPAHVELAIGQATSAIRNLVKNGSDASIEQLILMMWGAWEGDRIELQCFKGKSANQIKLFIAESLNKWATDAELF